jgi:predicted nucleic acid-binding protein
MPDKHLHIIAFDIPFPPNYGGVIDVFYKLKALHSKGIKIHLHCYEYPGRPRSKELNTYCEEVFYYPRLTGINSALSPKPYIVSSRRSEEMINRLTKDNYPILFEGLHSCFYLDDKRIKDRFKVYRESNIEHRYYFNLFKVDKKIGKKAYFLSESMKLKMYQKVLGHADLMLVVSEEDTRYLQKHFPGKKVKFLPSFHANNKIESLTGKGEYALYNGNIEVPENAHAVKYLINEVFCKLEIPLKVAGMNPPQEIIDIVSKHKNISLIPNPSDEKMFDLIRNAHVNILVTFQATGLKLKLLNTLYKGRFCLVNDKMLNGTNLQSLCAIANTPDELKSKLKILFKQDFKEEQIQIRQEKLNHRFSNNQNADKLVELVF